MDSYTTTSPFLSTLPIDSLDFTSGVRSGRLYSSIGVGTVTMKTRHGFRSVEAGREAELFRLGELLRVHLERAVDAAAQFVDAVRLDVEADGLEALAELDGERQADVAEADDRRPSGCAG